MNYKVGDILLYKHSNGVVDIIRVDKILLNNFLCYSFIRRIKYAPDCLITIYYSCLDPRFDNVKPLTEEDLIFSI